jgi:hypothetical protein
MVRDVFRLARENTPAIIFIDEIDAIATKRFDAQTGADREVQRILLELLNQMDGFDQGSNVKVGVLSAAPSRTKNSLCVRVGHNGHQSSGHIRPGIASPRTPRPKDRVSAAISTGTTVNFPDCNKQNEPWPRRGFGRLYETMRSFVSLLFKADFPLCLRRFTTRSLVLRRNLFSGSSRWVARHIIKFLCYPHILTQIHSCS